MKKFLFVFAVCLFSISTFAQSAAELKNAANESLRSKDYAGALVNFEKFFAADDTFEDNASVYNAGYAALKSKKYGKALKYFDKTINANYKLAKSYRFKAYSFQKMKKFDEMIAVLNTGIEACKANNKNRKLVAMLGKHYFKQGVKALKDKKESEAESNFLLAVAYKFKNQANAYVNLATIYFNRGASILQAATPHANTQVEKYKAEATKAEDLFKKALDQVVKAKEINPENAAAKSLESNINTAIKNIKK
ncbi:MAG: hypothetical protein N4A49_09010 [Marinifilaceae bacterium]|jgi:pilus assembly protein Flp/PilA|nr:hypothetical protein [Marinifilaceae bacterium]